MMVANFQNRWMVALIVGFISGHFCGCADTTDGRSAVVTGKVTLGGAPLTAGTVVFMADDGHGASVPLSSDGTYSLECRPNRFKVTVTPPEEPDPLVAQTSPAKSKAGDPVIPKRYRDLETSGLTFEAKEGNNSFDIDMTK